jgi:hypothetical protein
MKSNIYCDVMPCSLVEVHRRFRITYNFYLHTIRENHEIAEKLATEEARGGTETKTKLNSMV